MRGRKRFPREGKLEINFASVLNPIRTRGGGYEFFPLLKKSSDDPYLKFLDFSQLLVADIPIIFFSPKI